MPADPPSMNERQRALREEAAVCFAAGDTEEASERLLQELKAYPNDTPAPLWTMLLEIYQAKGERASFEKLADLFARRFEVSPPSWRSQAAPRPAPRAGRNAMVVEGLPASIREEKWRDFLASSKAAGFGRLDISRAVWPHAPVQFATEAEAFLDLANRITRAGFRLLLMGDGPLRDRLDEVLREASWPAAPLRLAWLLQLTLLQWRGQREAYDRLAMEFAPRFQMAPPGFEVAAVLADDTHDQPAAKAKGIVDKPEMETLFAPIAAEYKLHGRVEWDVSGFGRVTFAAATTLFERLLALGVGVGMLRVLGAPEMLVALFDATGVSSRVVYVKARPPAPG